MQFLMSAILSRWKRETRIRNICGRVQGEVAYYAPCGKKLKQYPDVMKVSISPDRELFVHLQFLSSLYLALESSNIILQ